MSLQGCAPGFRRYILDTNEPPSELHGFEIFSKKRKKHVVLPKLTGKDEIFFSFAWHFVFFQISAYKKADNRFGVVRRRMYCFRHSINGNLSGRGPSILLRKTVRSLKSPTGAFIVPLRSTNANLFTVSYH